jgi:OOP family OmpA-OmpF porin
MKKLLFVCLVGVILSACATTSANKNAEKAITVTQTPRGALLTISERILFDSGKSELKPESDEIIKNIAGILNKKTTKNILIEGHTDSIGTSAANQKLSERRAETVKVSLVSNGVNKNRLKTQGLGASRPKMENSTEDGRRINRRTEITILGEDKDNLNTDGIDLEASLNNVWLKFKNLFQ